MAHLPGVKLRILGEDWTVRTEVITGTDGTRAYCDSQTREIVLDPDSSGREDLLHETIHALENCLNVCLSEDQVQALSRGLWAVCRDNQELMRDYLFGADQDTQA